MINLEKSIRELLNKCSRENMSNTPDFILAEYIMGCLELFEHTTNKRQQWYGQDKDHGLCRGEIV